MRARHNRKVGTGESSREGLLHFARALDSIGSRTVKMRSREDLPGKEITLQYAAAPVTLPVPDGVVGSPISLKVVRIWGDDVEWVLPTSQPAKTLEQLQLIGDFYQHRWVIEEYHKALKSGLNVEGSQLRTAPHNFLEPSPGKWFSAQLKSDVGQRPRHECRGLHTPPSVFSS